MSVKDNLITKSRSLFLLKGYSGVSMRDIAKESGVSLGNIYYYFESKNALFKAVLSPLLCQLDSAIKVHNSEQYISLKVFEEELDKHPFIWHFTRVVTDYRSELYLLLFGAKGSLLEDYTEKLVDRIEIMGLEYLAKMGKKYPTLKRDISPFFMRVLASSQIVIMKELVAKQKIPDDEFQQFVSEYYMFNISGWKKILRV